MDLFRKVTAVAAALATVGALSAAWGQNYPTRPVKIIVPTGPGGSYDIVGRLLADKLQKQTGQAFVVENRLGAGSVVGTQAAAIAPTDGYTLIVGGLSNVAFNSGLYKKLPTIRSRTSYQSRSSTPSHTSWLAQRTCPTVRPRRSSQLQSRSRTV